MEVEVNSLEDMCSLMCDNTLPKKKPKKKPEEWIFTFGCGQQHAGKCVRIKGTYGEARAKMFELFGAEWCFQYSAKEWDRMKNDPNRTYPMEEELEVIE
jgi:hypothetical protein